MKKLINMIIISLLILSTVSYAESTGDMITLKQGYNAVKIEGKTLEKLVDEIGFENLISIQGAGQGTAYKKSYVDAGKSFLNSFTQTEFGQAYWVQVASTVSIPVEKISYSGTQKIALNVGWNFVAPLSVLSLEEITGQVGVDKLEVIQGAGQGTAYKKSYVDAGKEFLNSFMAFEDLQGYWIKVNESSELSFEFELDTIAKDNAFNDINLTKNINGQNYNVVLYTDGSPATQTSQNSIAVYGNINGVSVVLEVNDSYLPNSKYQVKVFNAQGEVVVMSSIVDFSSESINFGDLEFTVPELTLVAKDTALNDVNVSKVIGGENYRVVIYASNSSATSVGQSSIAVYGSINAEQVVLSINDQYLPNTTFQIKVFDAAGAVVGMSSIFDHSTESIDFGVMKLNVEENSTPSIQKVSSFLAEGEREAISFSIGDYGYILLSKSKDLWEYSSVDNSWKQKSTLSSNSFLFQAPAFVIDKKAYVVVENEVWCYTQSTDTWERKNDLPGESRRASFAFSINEYGYIGGGFYNKSNFYKYNSLNDSWTKLDDLDSALGDRIGLVSFVIDEKAYVTGTNSSFWEYDFGTNTWSQKAYIYAGYGQTFSIKNEGYVIDTRGLISKYDLETNTWNEFMTLDEQICYPISFSINNKAYIGVGGKFNDNGCTLDITNNLYQISLNGGVVNPLTPPTLTTDVLTETTESELSIEVNGEVGSTILVNGIEAETIAANGRATVLLSLSMGNNNFSITLKDAQSNESEALTFFITRNEAQRPFIITVKTDNEGVTEDNQFKIGTRAESGTYNYSIDCDGDGVNEATGVTGDYVCTYDTAGTYTVKIGGEFPHFWMGDWTHSEYDRKKLIFIDQWGDIEWKSMKEAFYKCSNMNGRFIDRPNLESVTTMKSMFERTDIFNYPIGDWNITNITDISFIFAQSYEFNQALENWDTSSVTTMERVFYNARAFNQVIENWDVSNVVTMKYMFSSAYKFNQPLGDWDVSNVTRMDVMFHSAHDFNQPINNWNVSNVQNMQLMFRYAYDFNQILEDWDISSVQDMGYMFGSAYKFNQSLENWNMSNMKGRLDGMFENATAFNQPLNNWNISNIRSLHGMFLYASSFNQPLDNWDVSNIKIMGSTAGNWHKGLFRGAKSFNQDLSSWDVSNVTDMKDIFKDSNLSTQNYNAILNTWSQLDLQSDVDFGAGTIQYSSDAQASRQSLIDTYGWTISDGGMEEVVLTDTEKVAFDKNALDLGNTSNITSSLTLPTSGSQGSTISWSSSDATVVSNTGVVTQPTYTMGSKTITLTATISKGSVSETKSFSVTVVALDISDSEAVNLDVNYIVNQFINKTITEDINLPLDSLYGSTITIRRTMSEGYSDNIFIGVDGKINYPTYTQGNKFITIEFIVSKGEQKAYVYDNNSPSIVLALPMSDSEAIQLAKESLDLGDTTSVTENLTLPTTGLHDTTITYSSNNINVVSNSGVVTRPEFGNGDATVILTATISKNGVSDTKSFTVVVKENSNPLDGLLN